MSGGEVLRHLLEEQQSYHMQVLNKKRAAKELLIQTSRGNSPIVKPRSSHKSFQAPRRALSDESPITDYSPHNSASGNKSHSVSMETPRTTNSMFAHLASTTPISDESAEAANNDQAANCQIDKIPNPNDVKESEITNCYQSKVAPFNPTSGMLRFNNHPKSNSAGEDSYHSERKSKFSDGKLKRRGKHATSITRSRSLHSAEKSSLRHPRKADAGHTTLISGLEDFIENSVPPQSSTPRKRDAATKPHDFFQVLPNVPNTLADLSQSEDSGCGGGLKESEYQSHDQQRLLRFQNNMVVIPSSMGGISQPSVQQGNPHGPYYAVVPQNSIGHHHVPQMHTTPSKKISPNTQQSSSVPRGPPPPYPQNAGSNGTSLPQRPNSLSLSGQVSRKKLEYGGAHANVGGLTSPALPTASFFNTFNFPLSATTPPHDTILHSFPEHGKATDMNQDSHKGFGLVSPIMEAQFSRGSMGQGYQLPDTAQSQNTTEHQTKSAPNTSGNAVTMKQQHLRQDQSRTYNGNTNSNALKQISMPPPSYSLQSYGEFQNSQSSSAMTAPSGYSLGKSDSNASSCSGGSRIARRTKRNSKNFSNVSGSSSSTGNSRPNSSADYLERILNENEALRNQLVAAEIKLQKYQHVEKELSQVTQDYQNFRLSVTKSENMQSTLIAQLESATNRTQDENEILHKRIKTLTEMVETLQTSNKSDNTSSTDISAYKVKVQELQNRERQLNEQYEEALEKISDQSEDIGLFSSSIERLQANVASLKAELLEKKKLDRYAESLSPFLEALTLTIQSREEAERELNEITVAEKRHQSVSTNDEGISEMDSADYLSPGASLSNKKQFVWAHAQMLKWQHTYLQTAILKELSTLPATATPSPLYTVLRKHRHAISEPSCSSNPHFDRLPVSRLDSNNKEPGPQFESGRRYKQSDDGCRSSLRGRTSNGSIENTPHSNRTACDVNGESLDYSTTRRDPVAAKVPTNSTDATAHTEADSPSEGYHSQQSSGSPTPSSEESQLTNLVNSPSCNGCSSLSAVGSGKSNLTKGVDV